MLGPSTYPAGPYTYIDGADTVSLVVMIGNGATPEVFTAPCFINGNRSINKKANVSQTNLPNCTDPTQPMSTVRNTMSTDYSISGAGVASVADSLQWLQKVGKKANINVFLGSAAGAPFVSGSFVIEEFELTGAKKGELVEATIKLSQAGVVTEAAQS